MKRTFGDALIFGVLVSIFIVGGSYILTPLLFERSDLKPVSYQLLKLALSLIVFTVIRWKTKWLG